MPRLILKLPDGPHPLETAPAERRVLSDLLAAGGFPLNTRCGKRGLCGGCEIELLEGSLDVGGKTVSAPATVRACLAKPLGDATLSIPARSRMEHRPQIGDTFRIDVPAAHQPLFEVDPGVRDTAFAIDIGTTTVAVLLVDLESGAPLSRASGFNQQIRFGDNVLTRIEAARDPQAFNAMRSAIVAETIAPLLERALDRAKRPASRIVGGVVAGNTTMLHLLLGEDPSPLGVSPFTPRFLEARQTTCKTLGLGKGPAPETPVHLLPGIAAYIGADIVAGIYATGMLYDKDPSLLVDIGTNGEVVLQTEGRLVGCATAAGPAFEGAGLRCGSRARHGAVSALHLSLDPFHINAEIIGAVPHAQATGICGSAYIDFLAEGREAGLLTAAGRFDPDAWETIPPPHRDTTDEERALRLAPADSAPTISEVDVAVILQAKAAIGAGIETLLDHAGIAPADISRLYLAGGFGMHLDVAHAIEIGLLPGFRTSQVEVVGNTALAGALLAAIDRTTLREMDSLRSSVDVLELNLQDGFEDRYVEHLMLP